MAADHLCTTLDPNDPTGSKVDVVIPGDLSLRVYKQSPVRFLNLMAVKHVLDDPKRIYFGLREYNEGGWCYTGRPDCWHIREKVEADFPSHLVFAVYVNRRLRVFEWRAERAAEDDVLAPLNWAHRYRGLVWKSTS